MGQQPAPGQRHRAEVDAFRRSNTARYLPSADRSVTSSSPQGRRARQQPDRVRLGQRDVVGRTPVGDEVRALRGEYPHPVRRALRRGDPVSWRGRALVVNIDLASTFAELAGNPAPGVEGRSLIPLLRDDAGHGGRNSSSSTSRSASGVPTYCGVHTRRHVFVRYVTREESSTISRDPDQLQNVVGLDRYQGDSAGICSGASAISAIPSAPASPGRAVRLPATPRRAEQPAGSR